MKFEYLFPEVYKKIGWVMFVVFSVLYVLSFSLLPFTFLSENSFIQQNDGWEDEICMVGFVLSLLFISFARLKEEDEYTINLRMKSMAWAFKVYGVIVIIATLTIYGLGWYYVMLVFVYLAFLLFIGKFYYELHKFRKEAINEE